MDILYRVMPSGARSFRVIHAVDGQIFQGNGPDVGQPADWLGAPPAENVSVAQVVSALQQRATKEGYAPPADEEVHTLMIQFTLEGWGSAADLAARQAVEQTLSSVLVGCGYGTVDGGDIGSGKMTIWTHVISPARAAVACVQALRAAQQLQGAVLVSVAPDDEGTHTAHWPEGYDPDTFSVL